MKNFKFLALGLAFVLGLSSCGPKARISGTFAAAPSSGIVLAKVLEGSVMRTVDTIEVKGNSFNYSMELPKGQPEFVFLYCGDVKVASLLLVDGDRITVECDTLGHDWTVSGSKDCELLRENELECSALASSGNVTVRQFIEYYRKMVKYVIVNSKSLTVVPVLFSQIGDTPVFLQTSDGILFNQAADSLEKVYPGSRYIKMLRTEGNARQSRFALQTMLDNAAPSDYPELELPDVQGKNQSLRETPGAVKLVVFWDATDPTHKIFNLETLKPVWDEFSGRGLAIYQVALGADKAPWALTVREQKMPWVNVCDTRGFSMGLFGVTAVPQCVVIGKEGMTRVPENTLSSIRKAVSEKVK